MEFKSHFKVESGSERNFGIVFAAIFALIAFYPLLRGYNSPNWWILAIAFLCLLLALFSPKLLTIPNRLWFKFGILLGSIIAPIVVCLVYMTTVVPIGLLMRFFGKDPMNRQFDSTIDSYWIEREKPVGSMKDQF